MRRPLFAAHAGSGAGGAAGTGPAAAARLTFLAPPQPPTQGLEQAAGELGLRLRRPDKKNEKAAVAGVRASLLSALAAEQDAAAALALVVPLLFIKATGALWRCQAVKSGLGVPLLFIKATGAL